MKLIDAKRLNEMIQIKLDIDDVIKNGLSQEEIYGYIDFFVEELIDISSVSEGLNEN